MVSSVYCDWMQLLKEMISSQHFLISLSRRMLLNVKRTQSPVEGAAVVPLPAFFLPSKVRHVHCGEISSGEI